MPVSAAEIIQRLWNGRVDVNVDRTIAIVPLIDINELKRKNTASVDLRLGRWFRSMRQTRVTEIGVGDDSSEESISKEHYVRFNDCFVLHPGQFVIGITLEWLRLPTDLAAYVTGKSSWGRRGLIIETAAGIHPSFTECLTLELANVGSAPIKLNPGMEICQIFFHKVDNKDVDNKDRGAVTQFVGYRKPVLGKVRKDKVLRALSERYFS